MRKLKARIKTSSRDIYETLSSPVYWLAYPQFLKSQLVRENQALCPKSNEYFLHSNENKMRKNCLARAMDYICCTTMKRLTPPQSAQYIS